MPLETSQGKPNIPTYRRSRENWPDKIASKGHESSLIVGHKQQSNDIYICDKTHNAEHAFPLKPIITSAPLFIELCRHVIESIRYFDALGQNEEESDSIIKGEASLSSPYKTIAYRFSGVVIPNSNELIMQTIHWSSPCCRKKTTYISTISVSYTHLTLPTKLEV